MCGICGFINNNLLTKEADWNNVLKNINNSLSHRGPDGEGNFIVKTDKLTIALGHKRLSIIDLSISGNQPLWNEDRSIAVICNGEIYNYQQITNTLEQKGHLFSSKSDSEIIIHLYEEKGVECISQLNGMFSFALWDNNRSRLLLSRDRIGIKPLFYSPLSNGLIFASEIKAIFAHPDFLPQLNESSVDKYLTLGYVPGPETIFRDVYALPPGHYLLWQNGDIQIQPYWKVDFLQPTIEGSEDDLIDELDSFLNDAVLSHLVSDVPVGAFLSGGVDSSLVAAIAQKHSSESLHSFTIGFSGNGDERIYAKTVSDHIGSIHHEQLAEPNLSAQLPRLVWHLDQPLFDNSILPTFLVSEFAKKEGKVVLSGDGGDEPFAGYDWTRFALALPDITLPLQPKGWEWLYQRDVFGFIKRLVYDIGHKATYRYLRRMTTPKSFRHRLYTSSFLSNLPTPDPLLKFEELIEKAPVRDERERFLYSDLIAYLPEDVLFKVDRMSMAHGLEVRVPLLDYRLVEWLCRLPFHMRFRNGRGKYLLREVAKRYLPYSILKPRKQGFTIPIGRWLHCELGKKVGMLFRSKVFRERGIIRPEEALFLLEMHQSGRYELGHRIWSLVVLEVWARVWLDGQNHSLSLAELLRETGDLKH